MLVYKVTIAKFHITSIVVNTISYKFIFKNFIKLKITKSKNIAIVEPDKTVKRQNVSFFFGMLAFL